MTTQTPAGWYPDPYGEPHLRWWDGKQWTDAIHAHQQGAPEEQPPSGPQPQPQPQSDPGWSATPANPTLQYGRPTHGQSAYGHPAPAQPQWGGPPPKQRSPLPWVFGGLSALVVLTLIVVAVVFVNRPVTQSASPEPPAPSDRYIPPSQEPPSLPPSEDAGAFPQPSGDQITDPRSGLSFEVPDGWTVPPYASVNSGDPSRQLWTAAAQATAQQNYDGRDHDWIGNVYTGPLHELYPYSGVSGMGDTAKAVYVDFSSRFYTLAHESRIVEDKAMKIGDRDAWVLRFELDFSKISEENGYAWKKENGAIVLMDRGEGQSPAMLYVSVPDNLGTDVVSQVLGSLEPA
ncbi:DUF2510 domain-containing protein [Nonomuraea terrae]|uniref:DUF2510 domain-containing protein n=1 Tax=Nonomuraea terrae TaxID=2530383 RepID=UPI001CB7301F|nr:DUF2510 domain-containing protein [Nonomuraea terrae]